MRFQYDFKIWFLNIICILYYSIELRLYIQVFPFKTRKNWVIKVPFSTQTCSLHLKIACNEQIWVPNKTLIST
jgi:hypothetical protein